eukprot:TRINITY_DN12121_c0_g1_i1.p1 TRINITY_DN12121_c0_g1~~TRINITY_DN12121_c0_g1_i1.p1  ORF type:complete len:531 (-),score=131.06 TRINITY_DN12121_c0_g1_i1:136-1698(-)
MNDFIIDSEIANPGKQMDGETTVSLRNLVSGLCSTKSDMFPGSQVVSLDSDGLLTLGSQEYQVCEKTDGVRFLLLIKNNRSFFVDRNYNFFEVTVLTPLLPEEFEIYKRYPIHEETIVDGELVKDVYNEKQMLVYYVFDCLVYNGKNIMDKDLNYRRKCGYNVVKARKLLKDVILKRTNKNIEEIYGKYSKHMYSYFKQKKNESFSLVFKPFYSLKHTQEIFEKIPSLPHENDGLVFTPVFEPYEPGTCPSLLKWKPSDKSTVDFLLCGSSVVYDGTVVYQLHTFNRGIRQAYDWITIPQTTLDKIDAAYSKNLIKLSEPIVECRYDPEQMTFIPHGSLFDSSFTRPNGTTGFEGFPGEWRKGGWIVDRVRNDRKMGNDLRVVNKIRMSLDNKISEEKLLNFLDSLKKKKDATPNEEDDGFIEFLQTQFPHHYSWMQSENMSSFPYTPEEMRNLSLISQNLKVSKPLPKPVLKNNTTFLITMNQGQFGFGENNNAKIGGLLKMPKNEEDNRLRLNSDREL